jgi:ribosome modulation factor
MGVRAQYQCMECQRLFRSALSRPRCPGCGAEEVKRGSHALIAAERRGYEAALAGQPRTSNPYPDHRTARGSVTFSRAFRRAWFAGYDAAHATEGDQR